MKTTKPTKQLAHNYNKWVSVILLLVIAVAIVAVAAYKWSQNNIFDKASVQTDKHATVAATVMDRTRIEVPSAEVAYKVVGGNDNTSPGTKIEALTATGTNYHGEVVLKITEKDSLGAFGTDETATHCYKYVFNRESSKLLEPQRLRSCPNTAPLTIPEPPDRSDQYNLGG